MISLVDNRKFAVVSQLKIRKKKNSQKLIKLCNTSACFFLNYWKSKFQNLIDKCQPNEENTKNKIYVNCNSKIETKNCKNKNNCFFNSHRMPMVHNIKIKFS